MSIQDIRTCSTYMYSMRLNTVFSPCESPHRHVLKVHTRTHTYVVDIHICVLLSMVHISLGSHTHTHTYLRSCSHVFTIPPANGHCACSIHCVHAKYVLQCMCVRVYLCTHLYCVWVCWHCSGEALTQARGHTQVLVGDTEDLGRLPLLDR